MKKMHLPDVNLWLALVFDAHVHHPAAKAWWDGLADETCFFCRVTQQAFLRLATNPRVFPADAVSMPYDQLPNWPASRVIGHEGRLVVGRVKGKAIAALALAQGPKANVIARVDRWGRWLYPMAVLADFLIALLY